MSSDPTAQVTPLLASDGSSGMGSDVFRRRGWTELSEGRDVQRPGQLETCCHARCSRVLPGDDPTTEGAELVVHEPMIRPEFFESIKREKLISLLDEIATGEVDRAFHSYLERLNAIPDVVSSQCCEGHPGGGDAEKDTLPYLSILVARPFQGFWKDIAPLVGEVMVSVKVDTYMWGDVTYPRWVFYFYEGGDKWRLHVETLIFRLER